MKVTSERQTEVRSRSVRIELDISERFEVSEPRYRQQPQRMMATGLYLVWERHGVDEHAFATKWTVTAVNIRKDGSLGASKTLSDWRIPRPALVTQVLAEYAPDWFEESE